VNALQDPASAGEFARNTVTTTFRQSTDVDSCVALTSKLDEQLDAVVDHGRRTLGAPIACRAGCSFCCHVRVEVLPHEAIALFRWLKSRIPEEQARLIAARVISNAERVATMSPEQHSAARLQCAFLVEGRCSAYPARPNTCAGFHSLDVSACERSYNDAADLSDRIPMVVEVGQVATATRIGVSQALRQLKLSDAALELHTAVAALLRDSSLIGRWRSGRALVKATEPSADPRLLR
jgi:Putative zinc- or iron-chelating domain